MSHLVPQQLHRYVGDPVTIRITIEELLPAQVTVARWVAGSVVKTLVAGIAETGVTTAVIEVDITKADTDALGEGLHDWQAAAGGINPPIIAFGTLQLDPRL